jgi:ribonuclease D
MNNELNSEDSKPQLYFLDKVDNSQNIFIPKLKEKINKKIDKSENLIIAQANPNQFFQNSQNQVPFDNPYKYEIETLTNPPFLLEEPKSFDKTSQRKLKFDEIIQVNSTESLQKMINILSKEKELAIDLEHHNWRSFQGFTCLIQISSYTQNFIIDCISLRNDIQLLNQITTNPNILKVFHGCDSDIEWLQKDFGVSVVNLLDTFRISKCLSKIRSRSLGSLLYEFCNVMVDKSLQKCDWRIRPLTKPQIQYAASDTHYLLNLKDILLRELYNQSNQNKQDYFKIIERVFEECKMISKKSYQKPNTFGRHFQMLRNEVVIMVGSDSHFAVTLFDFLWNKRDSLARQYDESVNYILTNRSILDLIRDRRDFEGKLRLLERKGNVQFADQIIEGFKIERDKFWGEKEVEKIQEEEVIQDNKNQNWNQIAGSGRFAEENKEDTQKVVDRNLKSILNMKIKFEVEMGGEKRKKKLVGVGSSAAGSLNDFLFFGVEKETWGNEEEMREIEESKELQIEEQNDIDMVGKEDFLEFDNTVVKSKRRKSQKKNKKQDLINRIENVNLPENLKMKLMKSVVGKY